MKSWDHETVLAIGAVLCALALAASGADWSQYRQNEARVKAIAANPEAIGEKELAFLMSHLYYPESITAIIKAHTAAAHAALWKLALDGRDGSFNAAHVLVERMTNKLECLKLLASRSSEVQAVALRGMSGCGLDRGAWQGVKALLNSDSLELRKAAAHVTGNDVGQEVAAREKAEALVRALSELRSLPGAEKRAWFPLASPHEDLPCLAVEVAYAEITSALRNPRLAVSAWDLRQMTPSDDGTVRDCLLIVRAARGDGSVKPELRRIVLEHPSAVVRLQALAAFDSIGTWEDLPLMKLVAEEDAAMIPKWVPHIRRSAGDDIPRDYHPLRVLAGRIAANIQRTKLEPTRSSDSPTPR
jgi:hypothetical protein